MRFIEYLEEMTLVDPRVSEKVLEDWREQVEPEILEDGRHVGDVEEFRMMRMTRKGRELFGLCTDDELIALFEIKPKIIPNLTHCVVVYRMITKANWRGKNLSYKIITFLCTRERWNVIIDSLISPANQQNLEKIAKTDYSQAHWIEMKTGKIVPFTDKDGKYQHSDRTPETGWQIMFGGMHQESFREERDSIERFSRFWNIREPGECRMFSAYENPFVQDTD